MIWPYVLGGVVALAGLAGMGWGGLLVLRPAESALAALQDEGRAWQQRYRAGQVSPNLMAQIQARLQARDRRGRLWSLDPFREQWLRWDGYGWQISRPPGNLRRSGQTGCGLLLIAAGLLAVAAAVVGLWWVGG